MSELKKAITDFYNQLEELADMHEELTDTDVREALALTLNYFFVWGKPLDRLPVRYYMFSKEGDRALGDAVFDFLHKAAAIAAREGVPNGQSRHEALQDFSVVTRQGNTFDLFIGSSDGPLPPEELHPSYFEQGS